jgi:hypothetical protein
VAALVVLCGVLAVAANGTEKSGAARLVFNNAGFSIAPLDVPVKDTGRILFMYLPSSGGISPNVSVQAQKHAGTLEEYAAVSKKEVETYKLTLISNKVDKGVFFSEYAGELQGHKLHFYCKAELASGLVYLATGSASEEQWKDDGAKLKACVDSFELTTSQVPAASSASSASSAAPAAK